MSDRSTFERWTKDQLIEHAVATSRSRQDEQLHRATLKRDLARAETLTAKAITRLDQELGGTPIRDLLYIINDIIEAAHPLSSSPTENTMRVTNPSSHADEGATTRRHRRLKKTARYRIDRLVNSLSNELVRDSESESVSYVRRQSALSRWHEQGKHVIMAIDDCPNCPDIETDS